jgi:hypothetical protein
LSARWGWCRYLHTLASADINGGVGGGGPQCWLICKTSGISTVQSIMHVIVHCAVSTVWYFNSLLISCKVLKTTTLPENGAGEGGWM